MFNFCYEILGYILKIVIPSSNWSYDIEFVINNYKLVLIKLDSWLYKTPSCVFIGEYKLRDECNCL